MRFNLGIIKSKIGVLILSNIVAFGLIGFLLIKIYHPFNTTKTPQSVLAPHITMGQIDLKVADFNDMRNFYMQFIGMQIVSEDSNTVTLGFNNWRVLKLINAPNLRMPSAADPGLDQIAIVFASRPGLAKTLQRVINTNPSLYLGGTGRGAVGEAFYVVDPSGNTLELYYDTDPSTWPRTIKGNVESDSGPIDIKQYINTYATHTGSSAMKLGHLQMRIGDINQGGSFYIDTVGFYTVPSLIRTSSIFMSDGFYHHDVVINQAQGYDGDKVDNYLGLSGFSIYLPDRSYVEKLKVRLTRSKVKYKTVGNSIIFKDPWGIQITIGSLNNNWLDNLKNLFY